MSKFVVWLIRNFERPLNNLLHRIRTIEKYLGPDEDWVEDDRRILFETFNGFLGYTTIYDIGTTDYVTTAHVSPDAFEEILYEEGYKRNLISGRKRRDVDGTKQYAHGSWAKYFNEDEHQHHVWIFESPDGGTDVYAHAEDNVTDSAAHLHVRDDEDDIGGMIRAAPRGLYDILNEHNIEYSNNDEN